MIPRPIRYRASRRPFVPYGPPVHGLPTVEFQQSEGDRWFQFAEVVEGLPFDWGGGAGKEAAKHLASALLLSRVSLGEAGELVDDMAALVGRMPIEGWEMDGKTMGIVVARLCLGHPIPDYTLLRHACLQSPQDERDNPAPVAERRLAALFGEVPHA